MECAWSIKDGENGEPGMDENRAVVPSIGEYGALRKKMARATCDIQGCGEHRVLRMGENGVPRTGENGVTRTV